MEPILAITAVGGTRVAELVSGALGTERDATDVVGNASFQYAELVILDARQLPAQFFDLSTGIAGAVLQKFSNHRLRLVIVGYDPSHASESLKALIRESNRGSWVWFVADREEALRRIAAA